MNRETGKVQMFGVRTFGVEDDNNNEDVTTKTLLLYFDQVSKLRMICSDFRRQEGASCNPSLLLSFLESLCPCVSIPFLGSFLGPFLGLFLGLFRVFFWSHLHEHIFQPVHPLP